MIYDGSCVGAGACSISKDEVIPSAALNVGSNSCKSQLPFFIPCFQSYRLMDLFILSPHESGLGCYPCTNIRGSVSIGMNSCWGFSACEKMSGNVTIGNSSCYGLKACSSSQDNSTIEILDGSCYQMNACKNMSGNVLINSSSCIGIQACQRSEGMIFLSN